METQTERINELEEISKGEVFLVTNIDNPNVQREPCIAGNDLFEGGIWFEKLYLPSEPDKNLTGNSTRISHGKVSHTYPINFHEYELERVLDDSFREWKYAHRGIKQVQ